MKINKNIMVNSALAAIIALSVVKPCLALNYDYVKMDGAVQKIELDKYFELKGAVVKGGGYEPGEDGFKTYPFKCQFTTDYTGVSGVQVELTTPADNISRKYVIVTNKTPVSVPVNSYNYNHAPFQTPLLKIINTGCSVAKDGAQCKTGLNDRPVVYASCVTQG